MNAIAEVLKGPQAARLGWTLLHLVWQGALVWAVAAAALALLRKRGPAGRYLAATAGLLVLAIAPVITFLAIGAAPSEAGMAAPAEPTAWTSDITRLSEPVPMLAPTLAPSSAAPVDTIVAPELPPVPLRQRLERAVRPWLPHVVAGWLLGVLLLALWRAGGWVQVRKLKRLRTADAPEALQEKLAALAARLRVSRPVRLLQSGIASVPTVIGWLRPVILIPTATLTGLTPEQLEAVLAHELAHIRRHDGLINTLQATVEMLLFYHPAVWWLSRRIRIEREQCCDDVAVAACGGGVVYGRALAAMAALRALPSSGLSARGGDLLARIRRIAGREAAHEAPFSRWAAGVLAVAAVLTFAAVPLLAGSTAAAAAEESAAPSPWQATLPSGATVELLGVSYHPSEGQPWWRPDGMPMEAAPYAQFNAGGAVSPTPNREFAYLVHPADVNVSCGITGSSGSIVGRPLDHTGARVAGLRAKAAHLAALPPGGAITFNVAADAWKTVATTRGNGMVGQGSTWGGAAFGAATERDGVCSMSLSYDVPGHAVRLVAVTAHGREHAADRWTSASGGQAMLAEAAFEGIRLEDVREFRLQARPYQRVEFRNVSLEPGHITNVEVVVEDAGKAPAASEKAAPDPEALMGQYHEQIKAAVEAYARDHAGRGPETADDILFYIQDKELAEKLRPALEWGRVEARKAVLRQRLYGLSHGLRLYREKHGVYPPDLKALEDWPGPGPRSALGEDGLASYNVGEHQVQYVIPKSDDPYEVLLYHWPPLLGEASVLHQNEHLTMLPVRQDGSLINPLTGQLIRGTDGDDKEAEKARAAVIHAVAAYLRDHVDALPAAARDLTPYVAEAQVLRTTDDAEVQTWARARKEANKYERFVRLSRLWQVLRAYRQEHAGAYPPTIDQDFARRYLGSADAISWPGFQLVYAPPRTASVEEALAYWWPLVDGGTRLLFADGQKWWVEATDNDQIVNPRTGAVIRPTQSAQPKGATPAQPHAAGPDTALGVAQRFLELLCSGKDDEELMGLTEPGTIRDWGAFLTPMRMELDLSKAAITGFWIAEDDACAVTSAFPTRRRDRTVACGLGLRRNGNRWLVCDVDALPTEQRREQFVQRFRDANPSARQVLPMQQAAPGGKAPSPDFEALAKQYEDEIEAAYEAFRRDTPVGKASPEGIVAYIPDMELAAKLLPVVEWVQDEAWKAALRRLHGLGIALALHRKHPGGYPKELKELEELGYLSEECPLESFNVGDQKVQYVIPQSDDPNEALLYYWPPYTGGTWVLYQNLELDWVAYGADGSLTNPRTGAVIRPTQSARVEGAQQRAADAAVDVLEVAWGEVVDGFQARLRPDKLVWQPGETPTFTLDFRNLNGYSADIGTVQDDWRLRLDGQLYSWPRTMGYPSNRTVPAGGEVEGILVSLLDLWDRRERTGASREEMFGSGEPLRLTAGTHTVCVVPEGRYSARSVASNVVQIEVLPGEGAVRAEEWGPPSGGLECRAQAEKTVCRAGEAPTLLVDIRNRGEREFAVNIASDAYEIECDGTWYRWAEIIHNSRAIPLPPGGRVNAMRLSLDGRWVRKTPDNRWALKATGEQLKLAPGQHVMRVAAGEVKYRVAKDMADLARIPPAIPISNPVEIVILPPEDGRASADPQVQRGVPASTAGEAAGRAVREFVEAAVRGDDEAISKMYPDAPGSAMKTQTEPFRQIAQLNPDWYFAPAIVWFTPNEAFVADGHDVVADRRHDQRGRICFTLRYADGLWQIADIDLEDAEGLKGEIERFRARHPDAALWQPDTGPVFGPLIEQSIQDGQFVDFDSGRLLEVWPGDPRVDSEEAIARGAEIGADALFFLSGRAPNGRWCMVNVGSGIMPLRRRGDPWTDVTAEELTGRRFPPALSLLRVLGETPTTMAIRTREGGMGILQIVGLTDDPPGVRIRYKMVQGGVATPPEPNQVQRAEEEKRRRVEAIVESLRGGDREVSQRLMPMDGDALSALEQFRDAYLLGPGENFKLILPPYMTGRQLYYEQFDRLQAAAIPRGPDRMTFRWEDSRLMRWGMGFGKLTLADLLTSVTGLKRQEIEDRGDLLERPLAADAIYRADVELPQLLPDIERALKEQLKWPVKLTLRDVERQVVVASGTFHYTQLARLRKYPAVPSPAVEIYGTQPREDPAHGAGGSGEFSKFLQWVGSYVGKPVMAEGVTGAPKELTWLEGPRLRDADGRLLFPLPEEEAALVLKHLSEQTGLTFTEAKRTVKILFVGLEQPPG